MIVAVTNDAPVYIEESCKAMGRKTGISCCTVSRQVRGIQSSQGELKFVRVEDIEEE